mgnify:FL=1
MVKIRKNTARKLFNEGHALIIIPCNCSPNGFWVKGFRICKTKLENSDFDRLINEFEYYNCNSELGRYTHYYIEGAHA